MNLASAAATLRRTPLHGLHAELGARMVPFAGYEMPLHYANGILKEHRHVRAAAGLFDVSHMGQLSVRGRRGGLGQASTSLETVVPADIMALSFGRQRYTVLTNERGGIRDDLIIAKLQDRLLLIVNAGCKEADEAYLRTTLADHCEIERFEHALLALQGPLAAAVLSVHAPDVAGMRFMDARTTRLLGADCVVTRSGYTGEDGFEISVPVDACEVITRVILRHPEVAMIGLGARDSLRLEAGLCLYGSDLTNDTTPIEAALEWSIPSSRRSGGERAGGFPGAAIILDQIARGPPRRRVGLRPEGRASIRQGARLFADAHIVEPIGFVSSGGFGPSVNAPIAMGYVATTIHHNAVVFAELRGERVEVRLAAVPFVVPKYKR
jgi:aminomethyltransferase